MIVVTIIAILAFAGASYSQGNTDSYYNYYWRQYLGEIPPDAIVGGHDRNGVETYIGQAYIVSDKLRSYSAIIPVEIHKGIASVNVPVFGVRENTTTDIKILCGVSKNRFQFYMTDSKHVFDQLHNKHLIPGGTEDFGITNIGRLTYGRELKIGKVDTFKGYGEAKIYFAEYASELRSDVYQILIYEDENFLAKK